MNKDERDGIIQRLIYATNNGTLKWDKFHVGYGYKGHRAFLEPTYELGHPNTTFWINVVAEEPRPGRSLPSFTLCLETIDIPLDINSPLLDAILAQYEERLRVRETGLLEAVGSLPLPPED